MKTVTLTKLEVSILADMVAFIPNARIKRRHEIPIDQWRRTIADIREKLSGDWDEEKTITLEEI
jgi:hypothetical protein